MRVAVTRALSEQTNRWTTDKGVGWCVVAPPSQTSQSVPLFQFLTLSDPPRSADVRALFDGLRPRQSAAIRERVQRTSRYDMTVRRRHRGLWLKNSVRLASVLRLFGHNESFAVDGAALMNGRRGYFRADVEGIGECAIVHRDAGDGAPHLPRDVYEALGFIPPFEQLPYSNGEQERLLPARFEDDRVRG